VNAPQSMRNKRSPHLGWRHAFSLVEVLAVISVIAILMAVAAVALKPSGESARRAARGEILAMLTRARSHAISSGNPAAMVMVNLKDGPNEMRGKSMTLYEVRRDEVAGTWEAVEQVRRWVNLPERTILLDGGAAPVAGTDGTNVLDEALTLAGEVPGETSGSKQSVEFSFVVFDSTGAVLHPSGSGRLEIFVGEGSYRSDGLLITRKMPDGSAVADRVVLSRLSGRAQSVESGAGS
jgi:prepilin-type N-terminal cleavage/methylation domain-containing protein